MKTWYTDSIYIGGNEQFSPLLRVVVKHDKKEAISMIQIHIREDAYFETSDNIREDADFETSDNIQKDTDFETSDNSRILDVKAFLAEHPIFAETIFLEKQMAPYGAIKQAVLMIEAIRPIIKNFIREATEAEVGDYYA